MLRQSAVCDKGFEELCGEEPRICESTNLGICESTNLRINESANLRINESANLRICESKPIRLFVYSSIRLFVYSSIRLFVYSSIRLFFPLILYNGESCAHVFFGDVPFGFVKFWEVGIAFVFAIDVGEDHVIG